MAGAAGALFSHTAANPIGSYKSYKCIIQGSIITRDYLGLTLVEQNDITSRLVYTASSQQFIRPIFIT